MFSFFSSCWVTMVYLTSFVSTYGTDFFLFTPKEYMINIYHHFKIMLYTFTKILSQPLSIQLRTRMHVFIIVHFDA